MADFKRPERVKNALDNRKLNLSVPCPGVQGKWSSLIWGFHANNPRLTVFTNDPNDSGADKGYGKISANLDMPVFYAFLAEFDKIIEGPPDQKCTIENKNYIFPGGKKSDKPVVVSNLHFGKNKDGVIWLSVTAPANQNRPKIMFTFGPSDFHQFIRGTGEPMTAAEVSQAFARGYIRILENMVANLAVNNYEEPPKKDAPGGGGGYGNRGGGGGGGGYGGGGNRGGGNYGGGGGGGGSDDGDDLPF